MKREPICFQKNFWVVFLLREEAGYLQRYFLDEIEIGAGFKEGAWDFFLLQKV
jgi:hypothetical protein